METQENFYDINEVNISDVENKLDDEDKSGSDLKMKPWNPDDIRITTKNFTIREIYTQIQDKAPDQEKELDKELELAPEFQRSFVWNVKQQIRLIETILLGIPLPAFYFNQDKDGAQQVIDGVQRLTTIKRFMSDQLELKAEYLEYLSPLKGSTFSALDPANKRRFASTQIVAHVIEPQTPDDVKYDIFNRVNTGGSPLTAQEIRHCMSKMRSREFLRKLVESESFDSAMGKLFWENSDGQWVRDSKRMTDREMALRFCAFYFESFLKEYAKASSLDAFLLDFSRWIDKKAKLAELNQLEIAFQQAMQNCYQVFGKGAFRRWLPTNQSARGSINKAIFESQALALADYHPDIVLANKDAIQKTLCELFNDPDYETAVSYGTGSYKKIKERITKPREALEKILK
ncbi:GmrSD restriction endonuclease domain-containing protein [Methylosoma difficile]